MRRTPPTYTRHKKPSRRTAGRVASWATGGILLCLWACSWPGGSAPGKDGSEPEETRPPVELTAAVDRAQAGVSDPVLLQITLDAAAGVSVSLPQVGPMIQGFRILDMGTEGPLQKDGRMWSREWFKLQADVTGSYLLPAVRATYTEPDGTEGTVETPRIFVEIRTTLDPEARATDIRDLKPPARFPREFPWAWALGAAGFLAAAGALAAWFVLRRRRREETVRRLPPDERARKELADVEATGILEEGRYREYVFALSLIFRRFLEGKYSIAAAEQTSEEIMAHLRGGRVLGEELKKVIRSFLEETDPIKYCGLDPRGEETETLRARFLAFLDRSARLEEDSRLPAPEGVP